MLEVAVIAEDEAITVRLRQVLDAMGARVVHAANGAEEPALWQSRNFDLIIVHQPTQRLQQGHTRTVMRGPPTLPFAAAVALLSEPHMPFATAWLDAGFDRCLPADVDGASLAAVIRALIRRRLGMTASVSHYGLLSFNYETQQANVGEAPVDLTKREAQVLEILLKRVGQIIPKERFIQDLEPDNLGIHSNAAEVYIHRLRKKISDEILPVRNIKRCGYLLPRDPGPRGHLKSLG